MISTTQLYCQTLHVASQRATTVRNQYSAVPPPARTHHLLSAQRCLLSAAALGHLVVTEMSHAALTREDRPSGARR